MNQARMEFSRFARFEMTTISSVDLTDLNSGIDTNTAGREADRTMVGTVIGASFAPGDRALMSGGGENDAPLIFAKSPYLF
jgi:hypothetical protein